MSLSEASKTSFAFKKLLGRDYRNVENAFYEETAGGGFNVHADDVWYDAIPDTPPTTSTSTIKCYTQAGDGLIQLTEDPTVPGGRAWYADDGGRLKGFVPPKFGQRYTVRLFEDNGSGAPGNEIFTTDSIEWLFDDVTGYLAIQEGHSYQTPFWIHAYHSTGQTTKDAIGNSVGGSLEDKSVICQATDSVGDFVYVSNSAVGDKWTVSKADPFDKDKMPAIGCLIQKTSATEGKVRLLGEVNGIFSGLTVGKTYHVIDSGIAVLPPSAGVNGYSIAQIVGVAVSDDKFLVNVSMLRIVRR